jgi:hypothetical protein
MEKLGNIISDALKSRTVRGTAIVATASLVAALAANSWQEATSNGTPVVSERAAHSNMLVNNEKLVRQTDVLSCNPTELERWLGRSAASVQVGYTFVAHYPVNEDSYRHDTEYWDYAHSEVNKLLAQDAYPTEFTVNTELLYSDVTNPALARARVIGMQEMAVDTFGLGGGSPVPPYASMAISPDQGSSTDTMMVTVSRPPVCPA